MAEATHGSAATSDHGQAEHEHWNDEAFAAHWLAGEREHAPERQQFALVRAVVPKRRDAEFRYLNLGAGPGNLDEVLLDQFPGAAATLVDVSMPMLDAARRRLERFGDRVEYVQANLASPDWVGGVGASYDFVFSTFAVHHLHEPRRIRALYAEAYRLLGHGGMLFNLDRIRAARPSLEALAGWAAKDTEAGLVAHQGGGDLPGTLLEHLGWLGEAGFGCVDVLWKDLSAALLCGVRDHIHVPDAPHTDESS